MSSHHQQLTGLQQQAARLIENRPSVFRTGTIVLLVRIISDLLSLVFVLLGLYLLFKPGNLQIDLIENNGSYSISATSYQPGMHSHPDALYESVISNRELGLVLIAFGLLLITINWLCHVIRRRNWYILGSYEVIEWVSALPLTVEYRGPFPHEKDLLVASDGSLVLTDERIVDRSGYMEEWVRLPDIMGISVQHQRQPYYKRLTWFFTILLAIGLALSFMSVFYRAVPLHDILYIPAVVTVLLTLSVICLVSFTRPFLVIKGRHRILKTDVHAFRKADIRNFISKAEAARTAHPEYHSGSGF